MEIQFTGRNNLEITPALRDHATEKMQRIEHRHANISHVSVVLQSHNSQNTAEGSLHMNGTELHAKADNEDMYTAIDEMADKLLVQVTKLKEKSSNHQL